MGFLVNEEQTVRHSKIRSFLSAGEVEIGVILAAVDFEWTVRRAIILLGHSTNTVIREVALGNTSSPDGYKESWKLEVSQYGGPPLSQVVKQWGEFRKAFTLRHRLVHGVIGSASGTAGTVATETLLAASKDVAEYVLAHGANIDHRLKIRRKPRAV